MPASAWASTCTVAPGAGLHLAPWTSTKMSAATGPVDFFGYTDRTHRLANGTCSVIVTGHGGGIPPTRYYPPFQPCFQPTPVPSALAPRSTPRQAAVPGPVVALYCTPRAPATAHVRILLCSLAPGAWLDDGAHNAAHALLRTHTRHAHACTRR